MISIRSNNESVIYCDFHSNIPDPFIFNTGALANIEYIIPVVDAFKNNLDSYLSVKFNKLIKDKNIKKPNFEINITFVSFDFNLSTIKDTYQENTKIELLVVVLRNNEK